MNIKLCKVVRCMKSECFDVQNKGYSPIWMGSALFLSTLVSPVSLADTMKALDSKESVVSKQEEGWFDAQYRKFRSYPHMDRAYKLMNKGQHQEAKQELQRYLELNPNDYQARATYITVLYKASLYNDVIKESQIVLAKQPANTSVQLYKALAAEKVGLKDQSISEYQAIVANKNGGVDDRKFAANALVENYLSKKQYAEALKANESLEWLDTTQSFKKDAKFYARNLLAYEGLGKWAEAERAAQSAIEVAPTKTERVRYLLSAVHSAKQQGQVQRAEAYLKQAALLDPSIPTVPETQVNNKSSLPPKSVANILAKPQTSAQLANQKMARKDYAAAVSLYKQAINTSVSADERYMAYMGLGYAYSALKQSAYAMTAFYTAFKLNATDQSRGALATALEEQGRTKDAITVLSTDRRPSSEQLLRLGMLTAKTGNDTRALAYLQQAIDVKTNGKVLSISQLQSAYYQQGIIYAKAERYQQAIEAFNQALLKKTTEIRERMIRQDRGYAYFAQKEWASAANDFNYAIQYSTSQLSLTERYGLVLQKAQCEERMNQPTKAIETLVALTQAINSATDVKPQLKKQVWDTLGYLYSRQGNYTQAVYAWEKSLELLPDPLLYIQIAHMHRLNGALDRAERALTQVGDDASLSRQVAATRWNEVAYLHEKRHDTVRALQAWEKALEAEPTAERHYRIGLLNLSQSNKQKAVEHFEQASLLDSSKLVYKESLAYAYKQMNRYDAASRTFEKILAEKPVAMKADNRLEKDLAYTYMQSYQNKKAVYWFSRAIDIINENTAEASAQSSDAGSAFASTDVSSNNQIAVPEEPVSRDSIADLVAEKEKSSVERTVKLDAAAAKQEELDQLRGEVGQLQKRWSVSAYDSYRSGKAPAQSAAVSSTTPIAGQGGIELNYQPESIGFRDGKTLNVVARTLWSNQADAIKMDKESVQGSVGVVYKPLKAHNATVGVERLIKIGENSQNNWLIRAAYGYGVGLGLKRAQPWWYSAQYYADAGYLTKGQTRTAYAEIRQGITFNLADKFLVTPHLVLNGRYQSTEGPNDSYIEGGAGVSLKYRPEDLQYHPSYSGAELLMQYKRKVAPHESGAWILTGVVNTGGTGGN